MGKDYGTGTVITAQTAIHLYDGDRITAPVVSSASVLNVHSGGTATNVVESGGQVIVENSATVTFAPTVFTNLTLSSASHLGAAVHTATLHSGTTANKTTLTAGYELHVFTGGVANSTTINYGCLLVVSNGGTANDNFVEPGGTLFISNGGVANRTSGGEVQVYKGGVANSTTVDRYMFVRGDATANSTTVLDGSVIVDGVMNDTTISGGSMEIFSGAAANRTAVRNGGLFNVSSGGTATSARVETGGSMQVFSSGLAKSAHLAGGRMTVSFGGTATSAVVSAGNLYLDGIAVNATVSGGSMEVFSATGASSGGTATATTVKNGGFFFVSPDAVASNTKIAETGSMVVSEGATADNTSMTGAGAWLSIQTGGTANNTTVSNGRIFVSGTANAGVVTVEGKMYVSDGGQANDVKVSNGGWMVVSTGGTANGAVVRNDGTLDVMWNGAANDTTVSSGGNLIVFQGGSASNTLVKYGGSAIISGNAENTTVNQMGGEEFAALTVCPGGRATSTTINSLGCMYISNGGQATSATVNYGGILSVCYGGQATSSFIKDYGSMCVLNGGQASGARVSKGGCMHVSGGGTADNTFLYGGNMFASAGATVTNAMVQQGATLRAYAGAGATGIVEAGGYVDLQDGVTATFLANTFKDLTLANESATVHSMTKAQNITLNHFGSLTVYTGGIASGTTVNGGNLYVSTGGVATGTTVNAGGYLYVSTGGVATGKLTIADGATVSAYEGAVVDFDISALSPASEKLVNDLSRIKGNPGFTLTIDGAEAAGSYNLAGGAADFDGTITVVNTAGTELGTLTVGGAAYSDGDRRYKLRLTGSDLAVMVDVGDITPDLTGDLDTHYELTAGMFASNVNVNAGGRLDVLNGGTANNTTVNANGYLYIESGGVANNTTVNSGGSSIVSNGGTADNATVNDGGYLCVESSGTANNATVNDGGRFYVSSNGTAANTTVNSGGRFFVTSGGVANNATVNTDGSLYVSSGGTATDITAASGAFLGFEVASGTYITGTYDGSAFEIKDGSVSDYTVDRGYLVVSSGGVADNITVNEGGIWVYSGGVADNITFNEGGNLWVYSGGTATNIVWTPCEGHVYVSDGGYATFASKYSGVYFGSGNKLLSSAAVMDGKVLDNNYEMYVMNVGTATNALVNDGGYLYVESGGVANNATVNSGGFLNVYSGGTAANATLNSRGYLVVSSGGTAEDTTVNGGAYFYINSGGTATLVRENGGYVNVDANADVTFASNTITGLVFSTVATIHSGTTATNATVKGVGSPVFVYGGGVVIDTTVLEGSLFLSGGVATDTAINSGGSFYVFSGGVADNTTVNSGGNFRLLDYDDIANNTTVNDGGRFTVTGHNTANGVVVSSGGSLYLTGKLTGNAVFETGAIVDVSGATVDFDLTQTTPGTDPLVNDLSFVMSSSTTYTLTVNGTVVNGTYSLAGGATGFDKTITVNNTLGEGIGTLSVGDVEKEIAGMQFSLALNGSDLTVTVAGGSEPDTTAPTVSNIQASITTPTNQNVTVTADFDDDVALKSRLYRLEGDSDWSAYPEGGVVVTENTTVYFKAVDTSGNECKPKFITIDNIDKVAPTITGITPSTTAPATSVTVTAVFDDDVELSTTLYRIGDGGWFNYHLEGVTVTTNTTVYFKATDTAGNATTASYEVTNIDTTSPDITPPDITVTPSTTEPATSVTVSAVFSDDVAVAAKQYRIGDGDWKDYSDPVPVTENVTVGFRASDTSGNATAVSYDVTNIENEPENDWLYKKKTKTWNSPENIVTFSVNEVTAGDSMVYMDKKGSVKSEDSKYFNSLGRTQTEAGAVDDAADYAKIELAYGAALRFSVDSTVAGKFYIYEATKDKKGDLVATQRKKITVKANKTSPAKLSTIYLKAGEYFIGMEGKLPSAKKKPEFSAYYNVNLTDTKYFEKADDGWNDHVYALDANGKEDKFHLDPMLEARALAFGSGVTGIKLDDGAAGTDDWVGFGDATDCRMLTLDHDVRLTLNLNVTGTETGMGKAKLTIWKVSTGKNGKITLSSKGSVTVKQGATGAIKKKFLAAGDYFVSVTSMDAKKGGDVTYNVKVDEKTVIFDQGDNSDDWKDLKTAGAAGQVGTFGAAKVKSADTLSDWVGYGDAVDYKGFTVDAGTQLRFTAEATDASKFAVYELVEKVKGGKTTYSLKQLQSVMLKETSKGSGNFQGATAFYTFENAGTYYFSMQSTNAKKYGNAFYTVSVGIGASVFAALAEPETESIASVLEMPETASVASALEMPMAAAAYIDSVQDKLFGESTNGLLASL